MQDLAIRSCYSYAGVKNMIILTGSEIRTDSKSRANDNTRYIINTKASARADAVVVFENEKEHNENIVGGGEQNKGELKSS